VAGAARGQPLSAGLCFVDKGLGRRQYGFASVAPLDAQVAELADALASGFSQANCFH
jgi:hypothetical protein